MTARPIRRREAGSAYLIVLLALVVLTILGLSLATITGLEMEVGTNERGVTRTFYNADSGVHVAVAEVMAFGERSESRQIGFFEGSRLAPDGSRVGRGSRVEISPFVPIHWVPCDWCSVNENEAQHFKVNRVVTSTATELSWNGNDITPPNGAIIRSQKAVTVMIEIQPRPQPDTTSLPKDPVQLAKVKF